MKHPTWKWFLPSMDSDVTCEMTRLGEGLVTEGAGKWCVSCDIAGTIRFELPACYQQNLGIFWGVWHFQNIFCQQ